jgi:hypothetical protein
MSESPSPKRPRFFPGELITAEDLQLEQQYLLERFKRHNRTLHGFGIVTGLTVKVKGGRVNVEPGVALDCEGNELVIATPQTIALHTTPSDCRILYLNLGFAEVADDVSAIAEASEQTRVMDSFELSFGSQNCNREHRHLRARWLACGHSHALTIAKLKQNSQGWQVERGYRAPSIK